MKFLTRNSSESIDGRLRCLARLSTETYRIQRCFYFSLSRPRCESESTPRTTFSHHDDSKTLLQEQPVYYNFSSLNQFDTTIKRHRRLPFSDACGSDKKGSENLPTVDDADTYKHISFIRRDVMDTHASKATSLSVDVSLKKFLDMFCDFDAKRCKLCNETFINWHMHQAAIPHSGRESLLLEMVRAYCGTPEEIVQTWWHRLNTSEAFRRIPQLSHNNSHVRKRRLQYLLRLLTDRGIIRDAFNVLSVSSCAGRSWEFERLEWLGDNVVKYVFNNRLNCLFPVKEGGIRGRLGYTQFIIDGNDGLARAYDFLELQQLTQSDRVVSKFKSDVVETLFGELQVYLWSTELDYGTMYHPLPFGRDIYAVRALVSHTMEELAHVMLMYHIEYLLGALRRIMRENQLQLVRADPSLRGQSEAVQELAGSLYQSKKTSTVPYSRFTAQKIFQPSQHAASLYHESTNYDKFKRVTSLQRLEPHPLTNRTGHANCIPHLQLSTELSNRLDPLWCHGPYFQCSSTETTNTDSVLKTQHRKVQRPSCLRNADEQKFYCLIGVPNARRVKPAALDISTLLDQNLISELL